MTSMPAQRNANILAINAGSNENHRNAKYQSGPNMGCRVVDCDVCCAMDDGPHDSSQLAAKTIRYLIAGRISGESLGMPPS